MTNYEKLMSMKLDDLVSEYTPAICGMIEDCINTLDCKKCVKEWLESEAEDD